MSWLSSIYVRVFSSHKFDVYSVHTKPSTLSHVKSGTGCIVALVVSEVKIAGFYFATLVYKRRLDATNALCFYNEGSIAAFRELFDALPI